LRYWLGSEAGEERRMPDKRKGDNRRARSAPTIDLTATEVSEPAAETPAQEPSAGESEPAFAAASEPAPASEPPQEGPTEAVAEPAASEPPPSESALETEVPPAAEPARERRPGFALPFTAGLIGGIIPAAAVAALWYGGMLPAGKTPDQLQQTAKVDQQSPSLQGDVRALQAQTKDLQARVDKLQNISTSAADTKASEALTQRVAGLEAAVKNLPQGSSSDQQSASRLAAVEETLKANSAALAAMNKQVDEAAASATQAQRQAETYSTAINQVAARLDEMAKQRPEGISPAQFESLQQQVAALKQSGEAAQKAIQQSNQAAAATRLAIATSALRNAVLSHAPYQAEFANAQALGIDAKQLAPLQRFASTGLPTDAQLADGLKKLLPALADAAAPQASGDFLERLRTNASRLVRVTPANAPSGDDPADVLTRVRLEADRADITGALADIQKLPTPAQQQATEWIAAAKARNEALSAARALSTEAARALGER
jgi:hypothetical protein